MEQGTFLNPTAVVAAAQLSEGMRVADIAAGAGFFTRAAARAVGEEGIVWALDTNRDLLPRIKTVAAAEGLHNIEVAWGNPESSRGTSLPAGYFDAAIAATILFASEKKPHLVAELNRILKQGGEMLVVDWRDSFGGLGPQPSHVVTAGAARDLFERGGFRYLRDTPAGAYHWGFIMKKG